MRSWTKQCPPEGRCAKHYLGNAEAGFTCGGQERGLARGSCSQGCHLASGLPRGTSAIRAGIRKRILNLDPATPRLAGARACSAEALAEPALAAPLPAGAWHCQKHQRWFPSPWEELLAVSSPTGTVSSGQGALGCAQGWSARVPRLSPQSIPGSRPCQTCLCRLGARSSPAWAGLMEGNGWK